MPTFGARFGRLIADKREERGWSLAELAVAAYGDDGNGGETRKSDVLKTEQGQSAKPNARTIRRYREALGLTKEEIDACKSPAELRLSHFADALFEAIKGAVAQTTVPVDFAADLAVSFAEGSHGNFENALKDLMRALELAAEEPPKTNYPDEAVDQIIAKVRDITFDEGADAGMAELKAALERRKEEDERREAEHLRLLDAAIRQAILTHSVPDAAAYVIEKMERETPDLAARFETLGAVWQAWYERGRDMGLAFDLEVSIALARRNFRLAATDYQRGAAANDCAVAMHDLAVRSSGSPALAEVVLARRAVLEHWTRAATPQMWAMAQMNLAITLKAQGERENGIKLLEEAVDANRAALQECLRDRMPLEWAMIQNNLGNLLSLLGQRQNDLALIREAIKKYNLSLLEFTRDRAPLDWAMTHNNIGHALRLLGEYETENVLLEQAVSAFRCALEERTQDRAPLDWATTINNLGGALKALGDRQTGIARLEEAVEAFQDALKERTRDRTPMDWAQTQNNLAATYVAMAEKCEGTLRCKYLKDALGHTNVAREEWTPEASEHHHQRITAGRDHILMLIAEHCP